MKFGLFYEHQLPQPWGEDGELRLYHQALDQIELADRLGIDYVWEVEHHFLEEYSHSSAPEVFLAACSQRTKRIHLGHGITLMPPNYNHPARVAERIATLDLVSDGRVEWGTGESSSRMELEGFGVSYLEKRAAWEEAVRDPARVHADRAGGEPDDRDGDRLHVSRGPGHGGHAGARGFQVLRVRPGPLLSRRHARPRPPQHLGAVQERAPVPFHSAGRHRQP